MTKAAAVTLAHTLYWQSNGNYYAVFPTPHSNVDEVDIFQVGGNSYMSAHPGAMGWGEKTPWDYEPMVAQGKCDANWVLDDGFITRNLTLLMLTTFMAHKV